MVWPYIYSILTAPGVMVHELAHAFFCWLFGLKIKKISLFRFGETAGYVIHESPQTFFPSFFIGFGPLLINSAGAIWLFSLITRPYSWLMLVYLWLGIALSLHAIPSTGDAKTMLTIANRNIWRHPSIILAYPFVLILYILNFFKRFGVSWLLAAGLLYLAQNFINR